MVKELLYVMASGSLFSGYRFLRLFLAFEITDSGTVGNGPALLKCYWFVWY